MRRSNRSLIGETDWVAAPAGPKRHLAVDLLLISVVTTVVLIIVLRLWDAHMRVPFGYGGDGLQYSRDAKVIVQTGWVQTTSRLGAPFSQQVYDFPISGDNGNYVVMRAMTLFTKDWGLLLNLFFLSTFYAASWSGYLCMRWLRCGRISAVSCALLFGLSPFHFARGAGHLMLSSYWVTPVAVLLAIRAGAGIGLMARAVDSSRPDRPVRRHALRSVPWVLLCICCASFGSYYAFFTMISVVIVTVLVSASRRTIRPLLCGISYCAVIAAMFVFNILPNLLYRLDHGVNPQVAKRQPVELDIYGLRLIQMVTPVPGEWFGPLRSLSEDLRAGYASENSAYFGLVASVALLAMLGWLGLRLIRGGGDDSRDARAVIAVLVLAWILIATTGGLDWTAVVVGFTQLRAWNRVSILLMFATLVWLSQTAGPIARALVRGSRARARAALVLAAAVTIFGLVDQGSTDQASDTNVYGATFASDKAFFGQVEADLPPAAMVYQLPYRRFPEEPPLNGSGDYDLYRPFLQTRALRFSYGGMKGRESDWQSQLLDLPTDQLTRDVVAVGFEAYVIDRAGYADFGARIEQEIASLTGRTPLVSSDGRWSFFDLTGLRDRFGTDAELTALRSELLNHPRVSLEGCSGWEGAGSTQFSWCSKQGSIEIVDPSPDGRPVRLTASVVAPGGTGTLELRVDGVVTTLPVGPQPTPLDLTVPSGKEVDVAFKTDVAAVIASGDSRDLRFQFIFPQVAS